MKLNRFVLVICFIFSIQFMSGENYAIPSHKIATCSYYNGYWGNWISNLKNAYFYDDEILFVSPGNHPANYIYKIKFNSNYVDNDKKSRKRHQKDGIWYEYRGTIEIRKDKKMSLAEWLSGHHRLNYPSDYETVRFPCTIRIKPYKKTPKIINIWFEDYGIGFDFRTNG